MAPSVPTKKEGVPCGTPREEKRSTYVKRTALTIKVVHYPYHFRTEGTAVLPPPGSARRPGAHADPRSIGKGIPKRLMRRAIEGRAP